MKIGMLTGLWYVSASASLLESLRRAAGLGFKYVDLHGVFHGGPAHLDLEQRKQIKSALDELGLTPRNYVLHALKNPAACSTSEQAQNLAYLQEGIDLAKYWGINQLMLNAGQWSHEISRAQAWQQAAVFLQEVCEYAEKQGIFIAQEPEPYVWFLVSDLASAAKMAAEVNRPNFTLLIDLGHMGLARETPQELMAVKDLIIHAHFSDHQPNLHTNQVIGSGATPTIAYLNFLQRMGIDQLVQRFGYDELVVSFELGVPGDQIVDPDGWVQRSLAYIRSIAPEMSII